MAQVTAQMVKQLREMTDSPMMECKKALVEADGDMDAAVDILRKNGLAAAAKKAGRATNEGAIGAFVSEDGRAGALVEVSCETDFVASNPKFTGFCCKLAQAAVENGYADVDALMAGTVDGEATEAALTEMIHVIGENMKVSRVVLRKAENGGVSTYLHMGGKIGVLAEFAFDKAETAGNEAFKTFAHDVAMQIAATAPTAAVREDVPQDVIDHEMGIYKEQAAESGKPEAIQEKMATGRLEKYFKQFVLVEQEFVKDSSMTVSQYAEQTSKACDDAIKVTGFDRLMRGEN